MLLKCLEKEALRLWEDDDSAPDLDWPPLDVLRQLAQAPLASLVESKFMHLALRAALRPGQPAMVPVIVHFRLDSAYLTERTLSIVKEPSPYRCHVGYPVVNLTIALLEQLRRML